MKNKDKKQKVAEPDDVSAILPGAGNATYEKTFLNVAKLQKQHNKCIYLGREHHERLKRIAQVIGNDKVPLAAYLTTIVEHHLKMFEEDITREFKEKYKTLF